MKRRKLLKGLKELLCILLCVTMLLPDLGVFAPEVVQAAETTGTTEVDLLSDGFKYGTPTDWTISNPATIPTPDYSYDSASNGFRIVESGTTTGNFSRLLKKTISIEPGTYTISGNLTGTASNASYQINYKLSGEEKAAQVCSFKKTLSNEAVSKSFTTTTAQDITVIIQVYFPSNADGYDYAVDMTVNDLTLKKEGSEENLLAGAFDSATPENWTANASAINAKYTYDSEGNFYIKDAGSSVTASTSKSLTRTITILADGKYTLSSLLDVEPNNKENARLIFRYQKNSEDTKTLFDSRTAESLTNVQLTTDSIEFAANDTITITLQVNYAVQGDYNINATVKDLSLVKVVEESVETTTAASTDAETTTTADTSESTTTAPDSTDPAFDSGLLVNGAFADVNGDKVPDSWKYYTNSKYTEAEKSLEDGVVTITAKASCATLYQEKINFLYGNYELTGKIHFSELTSGNLQVTANGETVKTWASTDVDTEQTDEFIDFSIPFEVAVNTETTPNGKIEFKVGSSNSTNIVVEIKELCLIYKGFDSGKLINGGFLDDFPNAEYTDKGEGKAEAWDYWNGDKADAATSSVADGILSVNVVSTKNEDNTQKTLQRLTVKQTVGNLEAGIYTFSGYVKIADLQDGNVQIYCTDPTMTGRTSMKKLEADTVNAENDNWESFAIELTVPENNGSVTVELQVGDGTHTNLDAYAKAFKLVKTADYVAPAEPETNGYIQNYKYAFKESTKNSPDNWTYYVNKDSNDVEYVYGTDYSASIANGELTGTLITGNTQLNVNQSYVFGADETDYANKYYKLTGEMKTTGLTKNAYLRVVLLAGEKGTAQLNDWKWTSTKYTGTTDWTKVSVIFPIPDTVMVKGVETKVTGFKVEQVIDKGKGSASFRELYAGVINVGDTTNTYAYDADNLLLNPLYIHEADVFSATPWQYYTGTYKVSNVDTTPVYGTDYSTTMADGVFTGTLLSGNNLLNVYQTITIPDANDRGYYYKITGQINANITEGNGAYLRATLVEKTENSTTIPITSVTSKQWNTQKLTTTADWQTVTMYIPVPEDAAGFKVEQLIDKGRGSASFKNIKVEKTDIVYDETVNLLQNPTFENGNAADITSWAYSPVDKVGTAYDVAVDDANNVFTMTGKDTTESLTLYQKVNVAGPVKTGNVYTLTGKVKADAFTGKAVVRIRLDGYGWVDVKDATTGVVTQEQKDGASLGIVKTTDVITGTTDWKDITLTFSLPEAYYQLYDKDACTVQDFKVEHALYAVDSKTPITGSVSFKDLVLTVDEELSATMDYTVVGDESTSLITNGGFERQYDGQPRWWSVWQSTGGLNVSLAKADASNPDTDNVRTGNYALHISNVEAGKTSRGSVHQMFIEVPDELQGQSVKIKQYVKTSNYNGNGLSIRLQYKTNSGLPVELTSKYIDVAATQDWKEYEYILDLPSSDLKTIKLEYLYDEGMGDIWIDDITVDTYIKAKGIDVKEDAIKLAIAGEANIGASTNPSTATIEELSYVSSNTDVATVNENGTVTGVAAGYAKITITHIDGAKKEVAVLVADKTFDFTETISVTTTPNESATGTLPDGYTYKVVAKPQYGAFLVVDGTYYYYPDKDFVGADTVTLLVTNSEGAQTLVVVKLKVGNQNIAPEFEKFLILTNANETATGSMVATDIETAIDSLVFTINTEANTTWSEDGKIIVDTTKLVTTYTTENGGTLTLSGTGNKAYSYVPATDYTGYDEAVITVIDGNGGTATQTVTIYVAEDVSAILEQVQYTEDKDGNTVKREHSYLLADDAKFEELRNLLYVDEDANIVKWYAEVKAAVDPLLIDRTPVPYSLPDGVRLDTQGSKDVLNLAFMYRMTVGKDDTAAAKYLERAWIELENLCNEKAYESWHPAHLLDVAMTASGVAIAYDWLYDALGTYTTGEDDPIADKRAYVEAALYRNAVLEGEFQYEDNHMFVTNGFNWNYVCNGGFAIASYALATSENPIYAQKAGEVLQEVYRSIQYGLPQYAPEGDSIEGVSYWDYGTRYLVTFLACVSSATDENPFLGTPGIKETSLFPIYMTGKAGAFNWSDNDAADAVGYLNSWFAEAYNIPSYAWYHKYYMEHNPGKASIYDLLYYNADDYNTTETPDLDGSYSAQAVTTMRADYDNADSSFVGLKGGIAGAPHGDLDVGSFIYDLYGVRWAVDLGKENYNMLGYWELNAEGTRWGYYRKDAVGHNTLIINPEDRTNQAIGTRADIVEQVLNNPSGGYTILDMTDVYQANAAELRRGMAYINRAQVLIRDEYILKAEGSDVYWQMHTKVSETTLDAAGNRVVNTLKTITPSDDGKTITLTDTATGKSIELRIVREACTDENCTENAKCADCTAYDNMKFGVMDAVYYHTDTCGGKDNAANCTVKKHKDASSTLLEGAATGSAERIEKDRTDYKKIYIEVADTQVGSISVLITPVDMATPYVCELDQWSAYYAGQHKITKVDAKAATCTTDGYIAHYECTNTKCDEDCPKYFADEFGTKVLTEADIVEKATGKHTWTYEVAENKITASCTSDTDCTYAGGISVTLTAKDADYSGVAYTGIQLENVDAFNTATGNTITAADVTFYDEFCTKEVEPIEVGIYHAAITVEDKIAHTRFEIRDDVAPTGTIEVAENKWNQFLNQITFGIFFKETQKVTITAEDNVAVDKVCYYVSNEALSLDEVKALEESDWKEIRNGGSFNMEADNEYVIYAVITDTSGNYTYISSDGLVIDTVVPVIVAIEDGKSYCGSVTFTVTENYIDKVTVDGTALTADEYGNYTIAGDGKTHTIIALDKAGNSVSRTITVYDGHNWSTEWTADENSHWYACTNGDCTEVGQKADHADDDKDCYCDICDYQTSDILLAEESTSVRVDNTVTVSIVLAENETVQGCVTADANIAVAELGENNTVKITGVGVGTTTITVVTNDGAEATCKVTVKERAVTLNKNAVAILLEGTDTLTATLAEGETISYWTSNHEAVVTVETGDSANTITLVPHAAGSAIVSARTASGAEASCIVTVSDKSIALDYTTVEMTEGDTAELHAVIGASIEVQGWYSSDAGVVTVTSSMADPQTATLTAVAQGEATITVTAATRQQGGIIPRTTSGTDEITVTCKVVVKEKEVVTITPTELTLAKGATTQLTATVNTDAQIIWMSDDTSVATVDANGNVTAVAAGTTVITAETATGTKASCTVTVNAHKLVLVEAKAPTCTEDGNKAYYRCETESCGEIFADEAGTQTTTLEAVTIKATGHAYGDAKFSWTKSHKATAAFTCTHDAAHVVTKEASVSAETTNPGCDKDGKKVYTAVVSFNGKEYTDVVTEKLAALGHIAGRVAEENRVEAAPGVPGSYDVAMYCNTCGAELSRVKNTIAALPVEPNNTTSATDQNAQPEENQDANEDVNTDENHQETEVPDKKVEVVEKEKVGKGDFTVELVVSEDIDEAIVDNFKVKHLKELLTKEEIKQMEDGANIKVYLEIADINNTVEEEQKVLVEEEVNKVVDQFVANEGLASKEEVNTKVAYLDVSLYKQVEDKDAQKLESTGKEPVTITIAIPKEMKSKDHKSGEYHVIRVHGKEITVLQTTLNEEDGTVTFETDRFSTYALVFTEKAEEASVDTTVPADTNSGNAMNNTWMIILVVIVLVIGGVVVLKNKKSKKNES